MTNLRRRAKINGFAIIALALTLTASAKVQEIPQLPPLRGDAANLKDTMKFIQEKLPGTVNYMIYGHDNITGKDAYPMKESVTLTRVSADADRCAISFYGKADMGTNSGAEKYGEILLKEVQGVSVWQKETMDQRVWSQNGHPEHTVKIDPPIAVIIVRWAPNYSRRFSFYDESLAERVSRALQHAVSLCGGGKPETF